MDELAGELERRDEGAVGGEEGGLVEVVVLVELELEVLQQVLHHFLLLIPRSIVYYRLGVHALVERVCPVPDQVL